MPPRVILRIIKGEGQGKELIFDQRTTSVVGRATDCSVVLSGLGKDRSVSRHHCLLHIDPPYGRIRDLGSLNGTFVNGVKVGQLPRTPSCEKTSRVPSIEHELRHGDRLKLGKTVLEFITHVPKVCTKCHGEIPEEGEISAFQEGGVFLCLACKLQMNSRLSLALEKEIAKTRRYATPFSAMAFSLVQVNPKASAQGVGLSNQTPIAAIYQRISTIVRDSDIIGEFGTNKLIVLLPMAPPDGAKIALERYLHLIHSEPVETGGIIADIRVAGAVISLDRTYGGDVKAFLDSLSADLAQMEAKVRSLQV
jgi:hypothetical protein